jgi:hypothetical protein
VSSQQAFESEFGSQEESTVEVPAFKQTGSALE